MQTLTVSPPQPEVATGTDERKLQGVWLSVLGNRFAELMIAGKYFTLKMEGGGIYMGTFSLDEAAHPRRMDLRILEGPAAYRGKTACCIYELDGDLLKWCPQIPGVKLRLPAFPREDDEKYLYTVFRRDRLTACAAD